VCLSARRWGTPVGVVLWSCGVAVLGKSVTGLQDTQKERTTRPDLVCGELFSSSKGARKVAPGKECLSGKRNGSGGRKEQASVQKTEKTEINGEGTPKDRNSGPDKADSHADGVHDIGECNREKRPECTNAREEELEKRRSINMPNAVAMLGESIPVMKCMSGLMSSFLPFWPTPHMTCLLPNLHSESSPISTQTHCHQESKRQSPSSQSPQPRGHPS
jgi:hypothetical protein